MDCPIKITVKSQYIAERSDPVKSYFFFAYHVTIANNGNTLAQLISRYWHITDANGNTEDVHGPGVVGEQPKLGPGEIFEYTSFCPLPTPLGTMEGSFQMVEENGRQYDAIINPFMLVASQVLN